MSPVSKNPPISRTTSDSFISEWSHHKLSVYRGEYGGERAKVPKGEEIPFPPTKIAAAVALLSYGAPKYETLEAVAQTVEVSGPLLRVWRTEARFIELYRRAVWECAYDYVRELAISASEWPEQRPSVSDEFQLFFGMALQQAVLRRLCVDALRMDWRAPVLTPKWSAEYMLIDPPPKVSLRFSEIETDLLHHNAYTILSMPPAQLRRRDPGLAQWIWNKSMRDLLTEKHLRRARVILKEGKIEEADGLIEFLLNGNPSPLDDLERLHKIVNAPNKERKHK